MRRFALIWAGQVFSLLGTNISAFGVTVWAYQKTGSATTLSLITFFLVTPMLIVSPFAGALVDRLNRKLMMMISDLASGLVSAVLLALYLTGRLEIWHFYVSSILIGVGQSFQWPAYSAAISNLVPKEQYGRANGLISLAETGTDILAPILAAGMIGLVGLGGILTVDLVTVALAIGSLLFIRVPQPQATQAGLASQGSFWKESAYGFIYILKRPGLLGLQLVFLLGNFFSAISYTLIAPMILARSGNNELILGSVNSIGALGGVFGGLMMSVWGGARRKVHGVLMGWGFSGIFGALVGLGQAAMVWTAGRFMGALVSPVINASNQSIWQAKVAPDVQGRVFSIRRLIAWATMPLATLVAGPLADYVMEPAMNAGGSLAPVFGPLVGVGAGAGMALIIVIANLAIVVIGFGGYLASNVRNVEAQNYEEDLILANASEPGLSD